MPRLRPRRTVGILLLIAATILPTILIACGDGASGNSSTSPPEATQDPDEPGEATAVPTEESEFGRLEPERGTYFGVNLDWSNDTADAFNERLGNDAAVYVQFVRFPFSAEEQIYLDGFFEQTSEQRGIALLTLEPTMPLDEITPDIAADFASYLREVDDEHDVAIMIRFAHEMNGSWYSWSQQPEAYVSAFRTMAEAVHEAVPEAAMLWAPNYGSGYPYIGGEFEAKPGSDSFELLDTDGDGVLTINDDPYTPFYPGDDVVDWVGVSLYHWGNVWPWGENELPEPDKFSDQITGNYNGSNGDERDLPDFYELFGEQHGKPIAIVETAALYNPNRPGPDALEIKRAWWNQVYNPELRARFPQIKMINWFEWDKFETEINGRIDWTLTYDPEILNVFLADFNPDDYRFAPVRYLESFKPG